MSLRPIEPVEMSALEDTYAFMLEMQETLNKSMLPASPEKGERDGRGGSSPSETEAEDDDGSSSQASSSRAAAKPVKPVKGMELTLPMAFLAIVHAMHSAWYVYADGVWFHS